MGRRHSLSSVTLLSSSPIPCPTGYLPPSSAPGLQTTGRSASRTTLGIRRVQKPGIGCHVPSDVEGTLSHEPRGFFGPLLFFSFSRQAALRVTCGPHRIWVPGLSGHKDRDRSGHRGESPSPSPCSPSTFLVGWRWALGASVSRRRPRHVTGVAKMREWGGGAPTTTAICLIPSNLTPSPPLGHYSGKGNN